MVIPILQLCWFSSYNLLRMTGARMNLAAWIICLNYTIDFYQATVFLFVCFLFSPLGSSFRFLFIYLYDFYAMSTIQQGKEGSGIIPPPD